MTRVKAPRKRRELKRLVKAYVRAPSPEPLVITGEDGLCHCEALFTAPFWGLRLALKYIVLRVACMAIVPGFLQRWLLRRTGMKVGRRVCVAPRVSLDPIFPQLISLGAGCVLGEGSRIFTHEYTTTNLRIGTVTVGRGSVIGAYSTIRSGVTIGEGVTVGFNSFVNRDVADGLTVGGVPARPLRVGKEGA
ncbi:MAG: acyltransferase [Planctomycetota bacterium]|jgi:hypothetical protein